MIHWFFYNMFELFIANFYKYNLENWKVYPQRQFRWHELQNSEFLPVMKPDIFFKEKQSGNAIFLDTKFMSMTLRNQWGNLIYHSDHLYQIYTYVRSQESHLAFHPAVSGILLYPAISGLEQSEVIALQNHNLKIVCINLTLEWADIEEQLLSVVNGFS